MVSDDGRVRRVLGAIQSEDSRLSPFPYPKFEGRLVSSVFDLANKE